MTVEGKISVIITHPLVFARFYWYFTSRGTESPDNCHAITFVCVNICPQIIPSKTKKVTIEKKAGPRVSLFYLYYLTWKTNKLVSKNQWQ